MTRIETELLRIRERLTSHPHPYEHGALYAAQQALEWVVRPEIVASPFDAITRFQGVSTGCYPTLRPEQSEGTDVLSEDASIPQAER